MGRDNFVGTKELRGVYDLRGMGWGVCEEYVIEDGPESEAFRETPSGREFVGVTKIKSKYSIGRTDKWRYYDPINEVPDLFLRFARLPGNGLPPETLLGWVQRYGLLGLNPLGVRYSYWHPEYTEVFKREVMLASAVLMGYEAVLNDDEDAARRLIFDHFPYFFALDPATEGLILDPESGLILAGKEDAQKDIERSYEGDHLWYLLDRCARIVEGMVATFCRPALRAEEKPRGQARAAAGWRIRNLLGAMYLQMYRLMAAGQEVTTCRNCGRIISLMPEGIGDRKTRQDKKYCDNACRQRYHYHNRTKLHRQKRQGT